MKKQKLFLRNRYFNQGFTFIETLISLVIISMISVCIVGGVLVSMQSYRKSRAAVKNANELLKIDYQIRNIASAVYIPVWASDTKISFTENSITLMWYKGNKEPETFSFPSINITNIESVESDNKIPYGMKVEYSFNNSEYECSCLFSSFPYGEIEL